MPFKGERVVVTGASGFIGKHLTERLALEDCKVYSFCHECPVTKQEKSTTINVDIAKDTEKLKATLNEIEPEIIFHLAAKVDRSRDLGILGEIVKNNILGTTNLLSALDNTDFLHFINTGSSEEYGVGVVPLSEDQEPNPLSPYSAAKASTTLICQMLANNMGLPITTLRPFLTYGPGQGPKMFIPSLIISAIKLQDFNMTDGMQSREFNYVEDIVEGYVSTALNKKTFGEVINLGSGKEYLVRDVAKMINDFLDNPIELNFGAIARREGEPARHYCSNKKARDLLGWEPKVDLETGLKQTISWYKENC